MSKKKKTTIEHIAIVCDGNRRWAKEQGLGVLKGHTHAFNQTVSDLADTCLELQIPYLTFWVFSTENWHRPKLEVDGLMNLFRSTFSEKAKEFDKKNIKINHIGDVSKFDIDIQEKITESIEKTKTNSGLTVTFAANYGGRDEIIRATSKYVAAVKHGAEDPAQLKTDIFAQYLDTKDMPDPDMVIRTSGEQRLSGFLLWQIEYAELFFPTFHFPDFTGERLKDLVEEYQERHRRFGG